MSNRLANIRANIRDFWCKVRHPVCPVDRIKDTCWEWAGATDAYGYASYSSVLARRISAVILTGRVPEGVSMSCENRLCVNPHHIYRIKPYCEQEMKELQSAFDIRTSNNTIISKELSVQVSRVLRMRRLFPMFMIKEDREFLESLKCPIPLYPMFKERISSVKPPLAG